MSGKLELDLTEGEMNSKGVFDIKEEPIVAPDQDQTNTSSLHRIDTFSTTLSSMSNSPVIPRRLINPGVSSTRVIKVGRNLKGYHTSYSIEKLLKWDTTKKKNKNRSYWIDIESPSEDDMIQLQEKFDLHPLTVNEILHPDAIEKLEAFSDRKYMFIASKELHYKRGSNELVASNINMIVFPNLVMTFHDQDLLAVDSVLNKIKNSSLNSSKNETFDKSKFMKGSDWVVHAIMNALVEMFESYTERIVMEGDALDELVLVFNSGEQNDLLRRIGLSRRLLSFVRTALRAKNDILQSILIKEQVFISDDIKLYLRDIQNDVNRMDDKLSVTKDTLNNLHQTYLAKISIEVAESANKVNDVMRAFSAVATAFLPINFIAGLGGMNVKVPYSGEDTLVPFFVILSFMVVCSVGILSAIKLRGWW